MKKILFCLTLTGCFTKPMTIEEVNKASEYCESNGMVAQVLVNGFNPGYPIQVRCADKVNNTFYDVPRK